MAFSHREKQEASKGIVIVRVIIELVVVLQAKVDPIPLLQLKNRCAGVVAKLAVLVVREDVDHLL